MPHKVLLVEDNLIAQRIAEVIIKTCGDEVTVAATGTEALLLAESQPFDLIIMDLGLPDIDGSAVIETLKAKNPAMPILGLTAHAETSNETIYSKPLTRELYQNMLVKVK